MVVEKAGERVETRVCNWVAWMVVLWVELLDHLMVERMVGRMVGKTADWTVERSGVLMVVW